MAPWSEWVSEASDEPDSLAKMATLAPLLFLALSGPTHHAPSVAQELAASTTSAVGGPVTFTLDGGPTTGWVLTLGSDGTIHAEDHRANPKRRFRLTYDPKAGCIIVREVSPSAPPGDAAYGAIRTSDASVHQSAGCP